MSGVALVKEMCCLCCKEIDGPIIMNTDFRQHTVEARNKKVEDLHGKVIGFTEEPCDSCKEYMEVGIIIVGFIGHLSDMQKLPEGFYRSGNFAVIKRDCDFVRNVIFEHDPTIEKRGFVFMDREVMLNFNIIQDEN